MELIELVKQPLLFRKKFQVAGKKIWVLDQQGNIVLFVKQKAFKLREDIRVYSDESMTNEMLHIQARQIIDFSAAYDVVDSQKGEKVGALARKGLKSMIRDEWQVLDVNDQPVATIQEDTTLLALLRRFVTNLVPQTFVFTANGKEVAQLKQHFNPFIKKADLSVNGVEGTGLDPRLALAGAVLLMAIEGRQG